MNELETRDDPPWSQPRPNWRKRCLLGILVAVPLCVVVPFVYFLLTSDRDFQEAVAEADRLDPGWRIPELEQKRAIIPDSENSGLVLIAAKGLLPPNWPGPEQREGSEEELRVLDELPDVEPCVQLDERQTRVLREKLQRAEKALAAVRNVAELPRGRYPIHYTRDFVSTLLPHTQDARAFGTLLDYDALLRAQEGGADGALTSCRGILNCGRSIGDEPTLISMLVRIALNSLAAKKVERVLTQGEPSEAALSRVQHALEAEVEEPLLLNGVRGERALSDGAMQAIQTGNLDPRFLVGFAGGASRSGFAELFRIPGMAKSIRAALLRYNNRFVEIAKLPVEQQAGPLQELRAAEKELPLLARQTFAASLNVTGAFQRNRADLRCAVVMLAVERYRRAKDRWPEALTDLVPAYLANVPLDPVDGAPLRYRRLADGVVIYSVGPDGQDNGGKLDKNPAKPGTDRGFRLWDVPKRRQPPNPPRPFDGEPGQERDGDR